MTTAIPFRLAVVGLVHDHVWNELPKWAATGEVEFVAVSDPHPPLVERAIKEYGFSHAFSDFRELFSACEVDVVQICTSNADGADVVEAAAAAGVHAVIEKPMSATLEQADRMLAAAKAAGTTLFVNWPNRWRPGTLQAWNLVAAGAIGAIFNARMRMAHGGPREFGCSDYFCDWLYDTPQTGGGALIDYCSYGAVAFRHLFGRPEAVQAVWGAFTKQEKTFEDNAAVTLLYPERYVVAEASWSQLPPYHDAVYFGTEGTLWTDEGKIFIAKADGQPREIPGEPLPQGQTTGPESMLSSLKTGVPPTDVCNAETARDAQEILVAGVEAASTGRRIELE